MRQRYFTWNEREEERPRPPVCGPARPTRRLARRAPSVPFPSNPSPSPRPPAFHPRAGRYESAFPSSPLLPCPLARLSGFAPSPFARIFIYIYRVHPRAFEYVRAPLLAGVVLRAKRYSRAVTETRELHTGPIVPAVCLRSLFTISFLCSFSSFLFLFYRCCARRTFLSSLFLALVGFLAGGAPLDSCRFAPLAVISIRIGRRCNVPALHVRSNIERAEPNTKARANSLLDALLPAKARGSRAGSNLRRYANWKRIFPLVTISLNSDKRSVRLYKRLKIRHTDLVSPIAAPSPHTLSHYSSIYA